MQAEGEVLSVRAGTNAVFQILHSPQGELAPLTCSYETNRTLLLTANAPADSTLQICTNLMAEPRWSTATNAVIAETTDAATTWRITLVDSPVPEFYRVLSSISLDAGIYARLPLHATQGIDIDTTNGLTMGDTTWHALPDTNSLATTGSVAAVASDLAAHASATNPHGITAEGLGAASVEDLNDYLPLTGGTISGDLVITNTTGQKGGRFSHGGPCTQNGIIVPTVASGVYSTAEGEAAQAKEKDAYASGYFVVATGFASRATGGRTRATGSYAEASGYGANATNERSHVWSGVNSTNYSSHGVGSWNIEPAGGLPNMWVGETNMADHIAAGVAPVEARVGELEETADEYWCKWTSSSISSESTNWIPTNWPARTVYCYVYCDSGTFTFVVPSIASFAPAKAHTLHLRIFKTAEATVYIRAVNGNTALGSLTGGSIIHRDIELAWRPEIASWICTQVHIDAAPYYTESDTGAKHIRQSSLPEDGRFAPTTNNPVATSLSLSSSPSLVPGGGLSPAIIQPSDELDTLVFDNPETEE